MDCTFCKIINNEIPSYTIYEDKIVKVILDIHPDANGHALLITKKHFKNLADLDQETILHIHKITNNIYELFKKSLHAEGLSLNQNNDYGQEIKHYHLHLVPRYATDKYHSVCDRDSLLTVETIYNKLKNIQ